jgi:hypothetical protein
LTATGSNPGGGGEEELALATDDPSSRIVEGALSDFFQQRFGVASVVALLVIFSRFYNVRVSWVLKHICND